MTKFGCGVALCGVGEPDTPPVANAIFAAKGAPARSLPFVRRCFTA